MMDIPYLIMCHHYTNYFGICVFEDSTIFDPTRFNECGPHGDTYCQWTMVYYNILHFIEFSRHIANIMITLSSMIFYIYILLLKKISNKSLAKY